MPNCTSQSEGFSKAQIGHKKSSEMKLKVEKRGSPKPAQHTSKEGNSAIQVGHTFFQIKTKN